MRYREKLRSEPSPRRSPCHENSRHLRAPHPRPPKPARVASSPELHMRTAARGQRRGTTSTPRSTARSFERFSERPRREEARGWCRRAASERHGALRWWGASPPNLRHRPLLLYVASSFRARALQSPSSLAPLPRLPPRLQDPFYWDVTREDRRMQPGRAICSVARSWQISRGAH